MADIELLTEEQKNAIKTIFSESKKLANVNDSVLLKYMESIGYKPVKMSYLDIFRHLAGLTKDGEER